ncbi:MAG: cystathionine beta-lyase [Hyphomonadaceae bacterium]|nr:cystathionine beta-lyase [Hyphomonadaceae bacterium]
MSTPIDGSWRPETRLVRAGRADGHEQGPVNPPIQRGSTVLLPSAASLYGPGKTYGLDGFAVHETLCDALADLVGAAGALLTPSGLSACTVALLACTRQGGEVLVTDSVYGPTRRFCDGLLARFGVSTRYVDPRIGPAIATMFTPHTQALFLESPGSLTMEIQDVPALAAAARRHGVTTIIDDTWSAGLLFNPLDHGVDISAQALTKYQAGHADVLMGALLTRDRARLASMRQTIKELGLGCGAPEDAYLALRGLRTMPLRLARQGDSALTIARWLQSRAEVATVLHPALSSHPDHDMFRRDFAGAAGVFSIVLHPAPADRVAAMLDGLRLFGLGFSWGGYESLIITCDEQLTRTVAPTATRGPLLRLSIGLEHPDDLIADLADGFGRLAH